VFSERRFRKVYGHKREKKKKIEEKLTFSISLATSPSLLPALPQYANIA
jgi:hypothetical protein